MSGERCGWGVLNCSECFRFQDKVAAKFKEDIIYKVDGVFEDQKVTRIKDQFYYVNENNTVASRVKSPHISADVIPQAVGMVREKTEKKKERVLISE